MDESSATEDDDEDDDDDLNGDEEQGMAGSLGDIIQPALLNKSPSQEKTSTSPKLNEPIVIHNSSPEQEKKSDQETEEKVEEEEELDEVIAKNKNLAKKQKVDLNVGPKKTAEPKKTNRTSG